MEVHITGLQFKFMKASLLSKLKAFHKLKHCAPSDTRNDKRLVVYYKAQKAYHSKKSMMLNQLHLVEKLIQKEIYKNTNKYRYLRIARTCHEYALHSGFAHHAMSFITAVIKSLFICNF